MTSKTIPIYCTHCSKYISKEDYAYHKETCKHDIKDESQLASFTFGGKHVDSLKEMIKEEIYEEQSKYGIGIVNKLISHNSFLSSILQLIWNMKQLKNLILNDMNCLDEPNNKLLLNIRVFLKRYNQSMQTKQKQAIDISNVRIALAELFYHKKKFGLDKIDCPIDAYFAIVNSLHSYYTNDRLNEISDSNCHLNCFAHKNLWLDIGKYEECQCGERGKRIFSSHNYVFDLPIDSILNLTKTTNVIEMSRSFKLKSGKILNEIISLSDIKEKLFSYYKEYSENIPSSCSKKCGGIVIKKRLFITNIPIYIMFNFILLENKEISASELLRTLILIPRLFELSSLFENKSKQRIFYEYVGGVARKGTTYVSYYKVSDSSGHKIWVYYEDENVVTIGSYNELVSYFLKNQIWPMGILYTIVENKYFDADEISLEDMKILEKYVNEVDLFRICSINSIRPSEDVIVDIEKSFYKQKPQEKNGFEMGIKEKPRKSSENTSNIQSNQQYINNNNESLKNHPQSTSSKQKLQVNLPYKIETEKKKLTKESILQNLHNQSQDNQIKNEKAFNMPMQINKSGNTPKINYNMNSSQSPVILKGTPDMIVLNNKNIKVNEDSLKLNKDDWLCSECGMINLNSSHKCKSCKKLNSQKENNFIQLAAKNKSPLKDCICRQLKEESLFNKNGNCKICNKQKEEKKEGNVLQESNFTFGGVKEGNKVSNTINNNLILNIQAHMPNNHSLIGKSQTTSKSNNNQSNIYHNSHMKNNNPNENLSKSPFHSNSIIATKQRTSKSPFPKEKEIKKEVSRSSLPNQVQNSKNNENNIVFSGTLKYHISINNQNNQNNNVNLIGNNQHNRTLSGKKSNSNSLNGTLKKK